MRVVYTVQSTDSRTAAPTTSTSIRPIFTPLSSPPYPTTPTNSSPFDSPFGSPTTQHPHAAGVPDMSRCRHIQQPQLAQLDPPSQPQGPGSNSGQLSTQHSGVHSHDSMQPNRAQYESTNPMDDTTFSSNPVDNPHQILYQPVPHYKIHVIHIRDSDATSSLATVPLNLDRLTREAESILIACPFDYTSPYGIPRNPQSSDQSYQRDDYTSALERSDEANEWNEWVQIERCRYRGQASKDTLCFKEQYAAIDHLLEASKQSREQLGPAKLQKSGTHYSNDSLGFGDQFEKVDYLIDLWRREAGENVTKAIATAQHPTGLPCKGSC